MKKPFAYVTAVWKGGEFTVIDQATVYCRKVYEAGFTPLCPVLYLPHFLRDSVPAEHKDGIDIGREFLRRSRVLIVCGDTPHSQAGHRLQQNADAILLPVSSAHTSASTLEAISYTPRAQKSTASHFL